MVDLIQQVAEKIRQADKIVIGASNGLSISEGIHIFANNHDFRTKFSDFEQKYGFHSLIQGCFYPFQDSQVYWAYFARLHDYMTRQKPAGIVMQNLFALVKKKDFFVVTSNFENHFRQAGFPEERLFEIEGNGIDFQCKTQCTDQVYNGEKQLQEMAECENGYVPEHLVPYCPNCGGEMQIHIELDSNFQQDKIWRTKRDAYQAFLQDGADKNVLFLELGVGARNQLIKMPFMQWVYQHPKAFYITVNKGELYIPKEIASRSLGVDGGLNEVLEALNEA
ncbi:hypothetical protein PTQ27_06125 [Mannheimia sp. AT1]|uniref:Deacetylase sirtuin-type domain-containing protein n=1 Tax=Mannheimia cairinae TaxID=3025936 RepID=A0ABT5MPE1_9PAST|nr:hypothetical protein [Mannheimia cairinae]MDD0824040.1 hypothetical protein [Mannheimia cairinae]MDD0827156.1 hypothetical protein [Mannheimia cairinae]